MWYNISMAREDLVATQEATEIIPMATIEGICNFSNLTEHDVFNGQDTGQFSMTITMSEDDASELAALGVKIKDYQGNKQRKFKSKYDVRTFDAEGNPYRGEVPYNSKVRLEVQARSATSCTRCVYLPGSSKSFRRSGDGTRRTRRLLTWLTL